MDSPVKKILIAAYNMGGPDSTDDVKRFLLALFSDPDLIPIPPQIQKYVAKAIVKKRLDEVTERYRDLGGASPQLATTQEVCTQLEIQIQKNKDFFTKRGLDIKAIVPLFRYGPQDLDKIAQQAKDQGIDEIWLLSQYPHCSQPTTGTVLRQWGKWMKENPQGPTIRNFRVFYDMPRFLDLWAKRLQQAWDHLPGTGPKHLLVSAHSIPISFVAKGDPYPQHIQTTLHSVLDRMIWDKNEPYSRFQPHHWTLAWQSAVGPIKWLEPSVPQTLEALRKQGIDRILFWPIAFVSDHIETLWEIDSDFKEYGLKLGFTHISRVPNLNSDPDYINFLYECIQTESHNIFQFGQSEGLRDMSIQPYNPRCTFQPGGCQCGKYLQWGMLGANKSFIK